MQACVQAQDLEKFWDQNASLSDDVARDWGDGAAKLFTYANRGSLSHVMIVSSDRKCFN